MSENQEKISKLISYWLRHKPEDGNIQVDRFGWAEIQSVIKALNSNNIDFNENQLIELNNSFDKIRWKIDLEKLRIKATHGHSISIEQEVSSEIPNKILFHGTASKNLRGIIKNGLISGQRQYVHLSEDIEMANEVGKRHGKPFLIEINTTKLIENGWEFFKTQQNVWLTKDIPSKYLEFNPWYFNFQEERDQIIKEELKKEVHNKHSLYGKIDRLKLIGLHKPNDDCLFEDSESEKVYVIHPTWSGKKDRGIWPTTKNYRSLDEWIEKRLLPDQNDWYL
ncbi:RNA 2'-phosphotransferase [Nonlabens sp. Asnod3-A02]|uniref:RNA 2'-phosphotransferase n=1 Tax=Nonlabens sp. Asnod3-A02 TaxID=3160579 RepID=UPI00386EAEEF